MKIEEKVYVGGAVILAGLILFLSVAMAGLEILAAEDENLRNNPVEFVAEYEDGTTGLITYKLPEAGILPKSPFYGLKKVRDWLWIGVTRDPKEKSKVILLIADKKAREVLELIKIEEPKLALESGDEAATLLQRAELEANKIEKKDDETKEIHQQIYRAGQAYKSVIKKLEDNFGIDKQKFSDLITKIDSFNEEQKAELENN